MKRARNLLKKSTSPPHAFTDDERILSEQAALEDSMDDDVKADADDESEDVAPPPKEKLHIPLKKKPEEKPVAKGVRIHNPTDKPATRQVINTTNLVIEKPLASKPPAQIITSERRSKQKHDPSKQKQDEQSSAPPKPAPTAAPKLSSKRKLMEEELKQKDLEEALERSVLAHASTVKQREEQEAAKKKQELDAANLAAEQADMKRKPLKPKRTKRKLPLKLNAKQRLPHSTRRKLRKQPELHKNKLL